MERGVCYAHYTRRHGISRLFTFSAMLSECKVTSALSVSPNVFNTFPNKKIGLNGIPYSELKERVCPRANLEKRKTLLSFQDL